MLGKRGSGSRLPTDHQKLRPLQSPTEDYNNRCLDLCIHSSMLLCLVEVSPLLRGFWREAKKATEAISAGPFGFLQTSDLRRLPACPLALLLDAQTDQEVNKQVLAVSWKMSFCMRAVCASIFLVSCPARVTRIQLRCLAGAHRAKVLCQIDLCNHRRPGPSACLATDSPELHSRKCAGTWPAVR